MNKRDKMYERINKHGRELMAIFKLHNVDPVKLCKSLRRIELKMTRISTDYCNGKVTSAEWAKARRATLKRLDNLLLFRSMGIPIVINGDPRGYALKIDDGYVRENSLNIHRDWGGYGILAPNLTDGI